MKKLIVSFNTYDWIGYCTGLILRSPQDFEIVIVRSQNEDPIIGFETLCEEARYEQRKYDLFKIGKKLGIRKMNNLRYSKDIDKNKLAMELQLHIAFGAVSEVYYTNTPLLTEIFDEVENKMKKIKFYSYGRPRFSRVKERIELTETERDIKRELPAYIVGAARKEDREFPLMVERFWSSEIK